MNELKEITLDEMMSDNAKHYPNDLAFEYEDYSFSWIELDKITDHIACRYLDNGVQKGTHVGIFSTNSPNWICTYIALAKIGAISVLINFNYKEAELHDIVKYASLEYLCYGDGYKDSDFEEVIEALRKHKIWKIRQYISIGKKKSGSWYHISGIPYRRKDDYEMLVSYKKQVKTSDPLSMILTSGTTSKPKGVILTHYQMLNVAYEAARQMHWNKTDKICLSLSLFHCFGLSTGLLASIATGGSICLLSSFRSKHVLEAVEKYKCTVINGVPSMFLAIMENPGFCEYNLSSLKSGIVAGSGIRKQDYVKIKEAFQIEYLQQSYGQTEASPSITFSGIDDDLILKATSVGRVISHVELRIADKDDREIQNPLTEGEIQIRGYNVMQRGYFKKKLITENIFTKDKWLKTGDLGYLDEQKNLFVTGRIKDVIIRCGENISPKEIEEVLLDYPGIEDVKVFGVPARIVQEEIAVCFIYNGTLDEQNLRTYLKEKLADYKMPKYMFPFKAFPLHANGKLNLNEMKKLVVGKTVMEDEE